MSTVTREFTKEQLIEHLRTRIEHRSGLIANMHIDRGYRDYLKLELRSSEIALASLEAEPVAWISERNLKNLGKSYSVYVKHEPVMVRPIPLYTAPPAPVSVPTFEEWCKRTEQKPVGWVRDAMKEAYDACRAAMLQGADGNSPVITDGWVMVPVDATRAMIDAAARAEEDGYDAMHKAMIAAAPQQEVKNG